MAVEDIGKMVARRREAMGLTQLELAERLNISRSFLGSIEKGKNPSVQVLFLLAKTTGLSVDALIDDSPTPERLERDQMERIMRLCTSDERAIILKNMELLAVQLSDLRQKRESEAAAENAPK